MSGRILTLLLLLLSTVSIPVQARLASARIAKITTPVATLHGVRVRLDWPENAESGRLSIFAAQVDAPDLGYRYARLNWECPLQRDPEAQSWHCMGPVRSGEAQPLMLGVDLASASTDAALWRGTSRLELHRHAAAPDLTRIDLTKVPLAWAQALLAQAWPEARLQGGQLQGRLDVHTPAQSPLRVVGRLAVANLALDTPDGTIAAEGLGGHFDMDYRKTTDLTLVTVDGELRGGEMLVGHGYFSLPQTPVTLAVAARQARSDGWQVPHFLWDDGAALRAEGSLEFDAAASVRQAEVNLRSRDLQPLRPRYLSGWLGLMGLGELQLEGALAADIQIRDGVLSRANAELVEVSVVDAQQRFRFDGLHGKPAFSADGAVTSTLGWRGGSLQGLQFEAADLPLRSADGSIGLSRSISVPMLGGGLLFEGLNLRPATSERGMEFDFSLTLQSLDVGQLAQALDWPPFKGRLDGHIPQVRYANDRLDLDGTLTAGMFDGTVQVSGLAMERPFGTAPTLTADIVFDDMNLQALTEVFGFGEITGALDGSIRQLRLVDWSAQSFNADLHTDPAWKGRRRISQRAVQDLSNVGGGSGGLGNSLQAQALKLFEDFGYRQIGIRCRLAEEVCDMDGLGSVGNGFIIVQGSGLPRLSVVGFNRRVDWPTLVERLVAVTEGESKPVFE